MSGSFYLYGNSLIQESPITDKYYLQLADHSLLDLLQQAVRSILIFNLPLQELPILHLQKEIYLIYDNRIIKEHDVIDAVKHQIRQTAKLQKKFLDMSFTYLEKEKVALSDMRDSQNDVWSVNWNKFRSIETDESLRKSYGVVANLFCNNYTTFVQSIREIARLLEHMHRECLIPAIDTQKMQQSLLEIVTHQFFLQYNTLDLHKVLPIMAQSQKLQFVFCSQFGIELRKKICKYCTEPSLFDIFVPKKQSPEKHLEAQRENKNELKQLMKEMFLRQFKNNEIISPFLFDQAGKLKLLDQHPDDEDDDDYLDEEAEREIARLAFKSSQSKKSAKKEEVLQKQGDLQQAKLQLLVEVNRFIKLQQSSKQQKKESTKNEKKNEQTKQQLKAQQSKNDIKVEKQVKSEPKNQFKPQIKQKLMREPPVKTEPAPLPQTLLKDKQTVQIPFIKGDKREQDKAAKGSESKIAPKSNQDSKTANGGKEGLPVDLIKSSSKSKQASSEGLQMSTTKIVLSSGTTLEARVTSLTISAEDPDKLNKNINLLKDIHMLRKKMSNKEVLEQIAKDYGQPDIKLQSLDDKLKEEDDKEENEGEEAIKKKKKRNKKKKQKKEQVKEQITRIKSESFVQSAPEKIQTSKSASPQKTHWHSQDGLTEEQRAIYNSIDNLQIDDKQRVDCKIDQSVLSSWRKRYLVSKKSFPK